MKNLMVYVNPEKKFNEECELLIKIQIDNSLDLGWKEEDIIPLTNFEYEYRGVKSLVVDDDTFCEYLPRSSKANVLVSLFDKGLIGDDLYWIHDLDVYELNKITEEEVNLGKADMGICNSGRMPRLNFGSIFFKKGASDIFHWIKEIMNQFKLDEENALMILITNNTRWATMRSRDIKDVVPFDEKGSRVAEGRIKNMNITYNIIKDNLRSCYAMATKPLKTAHFHILSHIRASGVTIPDQIAFYIRGENPLRISLVPERLKKIFSNYKIQ